MSDPLSPRKRSALMRAVKGKHTGPERIMADLLRELGVRGSRHRASLPGKPDFCFAKMRKIVFVHGCFWHRHACNRGRSLPENRREFWERKFAGNKARDRKQRRELKSWGWDVLVVWECRLRKKHLAATKARLRKFFQIPPKRAAFAAELKPLAR